MNKNKKLEEISKKLKSTKDSIGKGVDKGIFKTVLYLNYLGFPTVASCEGHITHGTYTPWIDFQSPKTENSLGKLEKLQKEIQKEIKKNGYSDHSYTLQTKYRNLTDSASKPTREYAQKLLKLLESFYKNHQSSLDSRLILEDSFLSFRLTNQGYITQPILDKPNRLKKLKEYQKEISNFTGFLKSYTLTSTHPESTKARGIKK